MLCLQAPLILWDLVYLDGCQAIQWSLHYATQRVHFPPRLPVRQRSSQCGFNTRPVTNQRSEPIPRLLTQNGARKSPRTIWPLLLMPRLPSVFNTGSSFAAAANLTCSDICAQVAYSGIHKRSDNMHGVMLKSKELIYRTVNSLQRVLQI